MAGISFGGMASGLPPNIVEQLMEAERMPIRNIERNKGNEQAKLDLVTELETKLSEITSSIGELASTRGFSDMKVESGDPNIITGVVDPTMAITGNWNVEVMELPNKAAAMTNGFPDRDRTQIGTGYFRFKTPEGNKEVYINSTNNTLDGAAAAINSAGVGLRASVINDRSDPNRPFKLMLSGSQVGGDSRIEYPRLYFLDGDQDIFFDKTIKAKNGKIKLDGFEFEVNDSRVQDVIPGVTLDLRQASPGRSVNISVKEDMEIVGGKVKGFVESINSVLGFIQTQNNMDANSDTRRSLGGDGLLRTIETRLRNLIQGMQVGVNSPINRLNQLGIEFNRSGTLTFDEEKFNNALVRDPGAVQRFLSGNGSDTGFVPTLRRQVGDLLNSAFGPVAVRKRGMQDRIRRMDDQIANRERMLATREASLRRQFAKLEETMSRLQSQGSALGQMGGGGGMMSLIG